MGSKCLSTAGEGLIYAVIVYFSILFPHWDFWLVLGRLLLCLKPIYMHTLWILCIFAILLDLIRLSISDSGLYLSSPLIIVLVLH